MSAAKRFLAGAAVTAGVLGIWAGALAACRQESADALAPESPQAYGATRYDKDRYDENWKHIPFDRVEVLTAEGQTTALVLYFGEDIDGVDLTAGSITFYDFLFRSGGLGINKGRVYRGTDPHSYVVEVSNIRMNGDISVEVKKGGYRFDPEIHRVSVQGKINTPLIEVQFVSVTQNGSPDKATTALYAEFDGPERPKLDEYDILLDTPDGSMWNNTTLGSWAWSWHVENGDTIKISRVWPWFIGRFPKRGSIRVRPCKNGLHFTPEWIDVEVFPWVEGRDVDPGVLPWPLDYLTQQDGAQAQRSGTRIQRSATPWRSAALRQDGTPVGSDLLPILRQAP